jgi:uncharacterized membrane protein YgcG
MTGRRFSIWLARAVIVGFSAALTLVGCGKQSEGERCDRQAAGDTDCEEGLVCVECKSLKTGQVDRCCPPVSAGQSTGSCARADPERSEGACQPETTGGRGGFGGLDGGGMSGGGGTSGGGASGIGGEGGA